MLPLLISIPYNIVFLRYKSQEHENFFKPITLYQSYSMSSKDTAAKKNDLISLRDYKPSEIRQILDLTKEIKEHPNKFKYALAGKELGLLFQKTSTRTRVSFEVRMHQLGGNSIYLDWRTTNFTLGDLEDEIRCISEYVDIIMARVYAHKDVLTMAKSATVPVINGL